MTLPALVLACVLAAHLAARGDERQGVIARGLVGLMLINAGRPFLAPWLPLYVAGFVAWYWLTARTVAAVLAPGEPRAGQLFAVLAASSGTALRLGVTAELARASFALALAVQLLAVIRFVARGRRPDDAQRVALILAASSLADLAGPWLAGHASRDWSIGQWPAMLTWLTIAAWEGRCLMRARMLPGSLSR